MRLLFSLLTIFLLALPARAETFRFPSLGFSFEGPAGWTIMSGAEFRSQAENADFGSDKLQDLISRESSTPFLSLIKFPMPHQGVNPGIHLNNHPGSIVDIDNAIQNIEAWAANNVADYRRIEPPTAKRLGSYEAARIAYSYSVADSGAVKLAVEETLWLVPMGEFYLIVSTGMAPDADEAVRAEIRAAVDSLRPIE